MTRYATGLSGLLAFPLTPFTDTLELDLDVFGDQVEAHLARGGGRSVRGVRHRGVQLARAPRGPRRAAQGP